MADARDVSGPLLRRLREYAEATGVRFTPTPRHAGWQELGLPDLRGFTPQRRTVRRFAGDPAEFPQADAVARGAATFDDLAVAELWLLHDLAHVIWYDVASVSFGAVSPTALWRDRDFFVEQHLASEAFAVLLLDYHALSKTKHRGLAVDLDAGEWEKLRASEPGLPALDSREMVDELLTQYLTGAGALFDRKSPALASWRDHEVSYSDKQRWYVLLWWDDLQGAKHGNQQAVVDGSQLAELMWIVLQLFTVESDEAFRAHVETLAPRLRRIEDVFGALPKNRFLREFPDFRFTDVTAVRPEAAAELLRRAGAPRAETLFLLWQLLALSTPDRLSTAERAAVATLAKSVQTPHPDGAAWNAVRAICERIMIEERWTLDPRGRAAFFLP